MARKVYISSDMSVDERLIDVAEQDPEAALLWPWILTVFDDWGRAEASPKRLKATIFPMIESVTWQTIDQALKLFAQSGLIVLYEVEGKAYMAIPQDKWFKYQTHIRSEKREKDGSRSPAPPSEDSTNNTQSREDARDCAQLSEGERNCIPSPSPSPSLSISSSAASTARARTEEDDSAHHSPISVTLYAAHERLFGFGCNPHQAEILGSYVDDGMDESVVIRALERAAANGTGYSFPLILKILNDYVAAGVTTIQQAEAFDNEFERRRSAQPRAKPRRGSHARDQADSRTPGTESQGDKISYGYYDQFPGLVKTVSDV